MRLRRHGPRPARLPAVAAYRRPGSCRACRARVAGLGVRLLGRVRPQFERRFGPRCPLPAGRAAKLAVGSGRRKTRHLATSRPRQTGICPRENAYACGVAFPLSGRDRDVSAQWCATPAESGVLQEASMSDRVASPAVPTRPQELKGFEKDINRFIQDSATEQARQIERAEK